MWRVERPDIDTGTTFDQCAGNIRNPGLRGRMNGIRQEILDRSDHYDDRAEVEELHSIPAYEQGVGDVAGSILRITTRRAWCEKVFPRDPSTMP